jgi:hypothetical protein
LNIGELNLEAGGKLQARVTYSHTVTRRLKFLTGMKLGTTGAELSADIARTVTALLKMKVSGIIVLCIRLYHNVLQSFSLIVSDLLDYSAIGSWQCFIETVMNSAKQTANAITGRRSS